MNRLAIAGLVVAGCTSSSHDKPIVLVDAAPDAAHPDAPDAPPAGAHTVVLSTYSATPLFVAYRDGAGPWQTPPGSGSTGYTLTVSDAYEVAIVCGGVGAYQTSIQRSTASDGAQLSMYCASAGGNGTTVAVTGQMQQPGTVSMSDSKSSTTGPWQFDLAVPTGTHDLCAFDGAHIVLRRNVQITGAANEPPVNLTQGSALTTTALSIGGTDPGDLVTSTYLLFTANDSATWNGTATSLRVAPAALLVANDFEYLQLQASDAMTTRFAGLVYDGTPPAVTLLPKLSGITLSDQGATWSSLPDGTVAYAQYDTAATRSSLQVTMSPSWLGTQTSIAVDLTIPGYDPAWAVDPTSHARDLSVTQGTNTTTLVTVYSEAISVREAPARARDAAIARARQVSGASRKIVP